jgi:SAM-dependent methyltransferase
MTLLRSLEYERLNELSLQGSTLDVGGGEETDYRTHLMTFDRVDTINIDPQRRPTFLADVEKGLEIPANSYANVISLNTLEHLWDDKLILKEIFRVLHPAGGVYIMVPFLYHIHASPSDYHRHTAFFWERALMDAGFSSDKIKIEPLTFGTMAVSLSHIEFGLPSFARCLIRAICLLPPLIRRPGKFGLWGDGSSFPLGYFISAHKGN